MKSSAVKCYIVGKSKPEQYENVVIVQRGYINLAIS